MREVSGEHVSHLEKSCEEIYQWSDLEPKVEGRAEVRTLTAQGLRVQIYILPV